jgi:hypothetical protein
MKLTPYVKLLKMGKEKVQELLALPRSIEMKHKARHEISKLDVRIAEQENKIQDIGAEYPIDFDKLITAQDELALAERRKKQLAKIVAEMFP